MEDQSWIVWSLPTKLWRFVSSINGLKKDFAKAFDTIDRFFLFRVLQARGFGVRWCGWISSLALASPLSLLMEIQESLSDANMVWGRETPSPLIFLFLKWMSFLTWWTLRMREDLSKELDLGTQGFRVWNAQMTLSCFFPHILFPLRELSYWFICLNCSLGSRSTSISRWFNNLVPQVWLWLRFLVCSTVVWEVFLSPTSACLLSWQSYPKLNGNHFWTV